MIKVQTLRLSGLCAATMLALAACSSAPNTPETNGAGQPLADHNPAGAQAEPAAPGKAGPGNAGPAGQEPQGRQTIVDEALKKARESMNYRLFLDARNEAAFVLELDNQNAEARDILRRCNEVLGDRPDTVGIRFSDNILQNRIALERERSLVQRELEQGGALEQREQYDAAIDRFEHAVTVMRLSQFFDPNDPLRRQSELALEQARKTKLEADKARLDQQKVTGQAELDRISREQKAARAARVTTLLDTANLRFQSGAYPEAVTLVDQALALDPTNETATALRDYADRARHTAAVELSRERWRQEWNATFLELQHANLPQTEPVVFDPVRWAEVSRRKPASYTPPNELDTPENRAVRKKLEETVVEHRFSSATLKDWADFYAQLTGVTFQVGADVTGLAADATTLTDFTLSKRSVADALKVIQATTGVAYRVRDGIVHLTTPENAIGTLYLERHAVGDLVTGFKDKPGPELKLKPPDDDSPLYPEAGDTAQPSVVDEGRLQEMLKTAVAPNKWDSNPYTMNYQAGLLLVRADKETHEGINRLLADLRRHVGIQVDVEARFLKVEDNFLEDVGVDLRGLGNQAAQGLPGRGLEQNNRQNAGFDDFGPKQLQNPASPGLLGTGTEPGVFYDDGQDGDYLARVENLYDRTLGGRNGGLTNAGGMSLQYAFLNDIQLEVVLRAVSKKERTEIIEAPKLLIYNNTRASMSHLRNISYIKDFEVEIAQAAAVANPVIGTVHDGVALDVRPVVDSELKFITMELRPTVMTLNLPIPTFTTTLGVGQPISIQLPEVNLQRVRTTVTMPDGGTMMLGGMRLVERQNIRSGVPVLQDIPGLSFLFSRQGTSLQNRKILILIRARIVIMDELAPTPAVDESMLSSK
jgi:tetratricopeptide (TPR) repeat protein